MKKKTANKQGPRIRRFQWLILPSLLLLGALTFSNDPRSASQIIKEHDAAQFINFCSDNEKEEFYRVNDASSILQCGLALELYESYPRHPQIVRVMENRWCWLDHWFYRDREVFEETKKIVAQEGDSPLGRAARIAMTWAGLDLKEFDLEKKKALVEEFIVHDPENADHGLKFLMELVTDHVGDPDEQIRLCKRALKEFGQSRWKSSPVRLYKVLKRMGETIEYQFRDLRTEKCGDLKDFRGKKTLIFIFDDLTMSPRGRPGLFYDIHQWLTSKEGQDLAVLGVINSSWEEGRKKVMDLADELFIQWPVHAVQTYEESREWSWVLNARGYPTFLLLDEQGRLAGYNQRVAPLRRLVE